MKKILSAVFVAFFVFCVLSLFSIGMSHYYFQRGLVSYHDSQDIAKWSDFNTNLAKAISCFEYAVAFNRLGVFDRYYMYDIYYYLTLSYWESSNIEKTREYISELLSQANGVVDDKRRRELENLKVRCSIVVNGVIDDGWRAIVNQNFVKENDTIEDVIVSKINDEYVEFRYRDYTFTDSVDRVNPLVKQGIVETISLIKQASEHKDAYYMKRKTLQQALVRAQLVIDEYALNRPDLDYLTNTIKDIKQKIDFVERVISNAETSKEVFVGMTADEVLKILGPANEVNTIYGEQEKQKWSYGNMTLYFDETSQGLILEEFAKESLER